MKKISHLFAFLLVASVIFTSYSRDNNDDNNNSGIGKPTSTTDPGVIIGEIDGMPIRWATRNINTPGTFVAAPEDFGMLFQWGTLNGNTFRCH